MPLTTSPTVSKSSSVGLPNLFMSKCVREREYLLVASDRSRQPELSLTTDLCANSQPWQDRRLALTRKPTVRSLFPTIRPTLLDFSS
jgi:hypothetical protein